MGSCCGGRKADSKEIEVTLRDGSKRRVASLPEARLVMAADDTVGNPTQTWRWVPKIAKAS
jgi:hypothetical protein